MIKTKSAYSYDDSFFDWVDAGANRSAQLLLPFLRERISMNSVVDVGCATGAWLSVWRDLGINDVFGVDGSYVRPERLQIPREWFQVADLAMPFDVPRRFDLVQSLEVAEHLPCSASEAFIASLCKLGDIVVFSAATPGQGGEMHVNEQPLEFWRRRFRMLGYFPFDFVRPALARDCRIEPWYRYNCLIYANTEGERRLSEDALGARVQGRIDSYSDWQWRIRCAILRPMPVALVTALSKINYKIKNTYTTWKKGTHGTKGGTQ